MKCTFFSSSLLTALFLGALAAGCNKTDSASSTTTTTTTTNSAVEDAKSEIKAAAASAGEKIKETTEKATAATKEATQNISNSVKPAEPAATNAPAAAQGLIDKAKSYITEGKYKEGLASLKQASNYQLSPEQQKTVDDLKARAQEYFSNGISKSIGGLLHRTNTAPATNP
jgi:hypothetical protein